MQNLGFGVKQSLSIMGITGVTFCIIAILMNHSSVLPDLLIGLGTSCLYYLLLQYQYKKSKQMPPDKAVAYLKKGGASRFCLMFVGITLVFHDPGISIMAFLAGAILPYRVVIFCRSMALLQKELQEAEHVRGLDHCENHVYGTSINHPLLHPYYRWEQSRYRSRTPFHS